MGVPDLGSKLRIQNLLVASCQVLNFDPRTDMGKYRPHSKRRFHAQNDKPRIVPWSIGTIHVWFTRSSPYTLGCLKNLEDHSIPLITWAYPCLRDIPDTPSFLVGMCLKNLLWWSKIKRDYPPCRIGVLKWDIIPIKPLDLSSSRLIRW